MRRRHSRELTNQGSRSHFTESAPKCRFDHYRHTLLTRLPDLRRVRLVGTDDEQVGATNRCRVLELVLGGEGLANVRLVDSCSGESDCPAS